ncbi:hypothetical protein TNCV_2065941 [Trichonephila clavipes]|nr:hypothetical protein TNCV_2065941 [Trichonephila clavipes]
MTPPLPAKEVVCRCKANPVLRFHHGVSTHTKTVVITVEIESPFFAKDNLVSFRCSPFSSYAAPQQTEASMGGRQGQNEAMGVVIPNVFSQVP